MERARSSIVNRGGCAPISGRVPNRCDGDGQGSARWAGRAELGGRAKGGRALEEIALRSNKTCKSVELRHQLDLKQELELEPK